MQIGRIMVRFSESGAWDRARLLAEAAAHRERARAVAGVANQSRHANVKATLVDFADLLDRDAAAFEAKAAILQAITAANDRTSGISSAQRA